jgi:arsenate reductase-like glutaredoxin family protein
MSCKKAQEFLERHAVAVKTKADAHKEKQGRAEALALAKSVGVIHVSKGKKSVTIDMKDSPDDDTLVGYLLGPTGNLRAPTIKNGKTLYVGFNEEAYRKMIGGVSGVRHT